MIVTREQIDDALAAYERAAYACGEWTPQDKDLYSTRQTKLDEAEARVHALLDKVIPDWESLRARQQEIADAK